MSKFFIELNHLNLLKVKGEDAEKFLQGQLTCDVNALKNLQSCPGAACDNKGRVFATFHLSKIENNFYLEMPQGLQENAKVALDKYIPFYKAEIEIANAEFNRIGIAGSDCASALGKLFPLLPTKAGQIIYHQEKFLVSLNAESSRFLLWQKKPHDSIEQLGKIGITRGEANDWLTLDIENGSYQLDAQNISQYTPEELNLDLSGAINFKKGCYTGQEIVARMHYRGKAKKRLQHLSILSETDVKLGTIIYNEEKTKKYGTIVNLVKTDRSSYQVLAVLNTPAAVNTSTKDKLELSQTTPSKMFSIDGDTNAKIHLIAIDYK